MRRLKLINVNDMLVLHYNNIVALRLSDGCFPCLSWYVYYSELVKKLGAVGCRFYSYLSLLLLLAGWKLGLFCLIMYIVGLVKKLRGCRFLFLCLPSFGWLEGGFVDLF